LFAENRKIYSEIDTLLAVYNISIQNDLLGCFTGQFRMRKMPYSLLGKGLEINGFTKV
jgi:hypothetical protein